MKRFFLITVYVLVVTGVFSVTGKEVMEDMRDKDAPSSTHALLGLEIAESNGSVKKRIIEMWGVDIDDLTKTIMVFRAPTSVKNTRFLVKESGNGADNKWIFMPALGKVRRIAASDGGSSFMGTEFTYDDMSSREVEDDTHKLLREEVLDGYKCYVIESIPKELDNAQYGRRVQWIIEDKLLPIKVALYNKKGVLNKVLTVADIVNHEGFWIPNRTTMKNVLNGRSSTIINKKIELNKKINPALFEKRFLTTGKVK